MVQRRRLVDWNAMYACKKGGEKMSKFPAWLLVILNFLMSDLFEQLIDWAKEIVQSLNLSGVTDKDDARKEAVALLRAKAQTEGLAVNRWKAGQAVEAAYAELYPWKAKGVSV